MLQANRKKHLKWVFLYLKEAKTLIEIYPNVFVGDENDYLNLGKEHIPGRNIDQPTGDWAVLHCNKEPHHRQFVGYTGRGAPKDHPEYLVARRENRMALNMVDAKSPQFFSKEMIISGLNFLDECYKAGKKLLIHCNLGESRGPSIGMLFVLKRAVPLDEKEQQIPIETFEDAEVSFKQVYPSYNPGEGIKGHLQQFWSEY